jgi:arsenate reductase
MAKKVLILCTGNSCRSQMAEGLINTRLSPEFQAFSAGTDPSSYVHPKTIAAMTELNIDLSQYESKHLDQFQGQYFDYVITVCDSANENCPVWLGQAGARHHLGFDDPVKATGTDEQIMAEFRRVRDEIAVKLLNFLRQQPPNRKSKYEKLAGRIKLLAHPERLQILDVLRREAECVCHLEALLDKPQPYVSQQLRLLREAGIIQNEQVGHNVYYRLVDPDTAAWLAEILGPAEGEHSEIAYYKRLISCDCPKCEEANNPVGLSRDLELKTD